MRQEIRDQLIKQIKDREQSFITMKQKECENNKKIVSNFKQNNEKYEKSELKKRTNVLHFKFTLARTFALDVKLRAAAVNGHLDGPGV